MKINMIRADSLPLYSAQVQANLCFVDREVTDEDEGWEGLDARLTCNRDELSYVDEDAAE